MTQAIGYLRVSTDEQADSHLGLEAQRSAILAACESRGWPVVFVEEAVSAKRSKRRPVLDSARAKLRAGGADVLMATKIDRLARSVIDFSELLEESLDRRHGYRVLTLDAAGIDTGTATGRAMVRMLAVFAEWERDIISERTVAALAALKARGVKLGAPVQITPEVDARIRQMSDRGLSTRAIARTLTEAGERTVKGGTEWQHSTIADLLLRRT